MLCRAKTWIIRGTVVRIKLISFIEAISRTALAAVLTPQFCVEEPGLAPKRLMRAPVARKLTATQATGFPLAGMAKLEDIFAQSHRAGRAIPLTSNELGLDRICRC